MGNSSDGIEFPLDAFPNQISELIAHYEDRLKFDRNASALAVLVHTASILEMGTSFEIMGMKQPPIIWANIIQDSGTAKGHLMDNYMAYLFEQNKNLENTDAMHTYYTTNFTLEGLLKKNINNPKGVMIYKDELSSLVKGFSNYNASGVKEDMMNLWNGGPQVIARSNDAPLRIPNVKPNMLGATQPEKVINLFSDESLTDGFTPRFLNCEVFDSSYSKRSREKADKNLLKLINYRINAPLWNLQAQTYIASKEADEHWLDWSDARRKTYWNFKQYKMYQSKLDSYATRLSGILHALHINDYEKQDSKSYLPTEIPLHIVEKATKVCDFFMGQYERMLNNLSVQRFPNAIQKELNKMNPKFQALYGQLNGRKYTNGELVTHFKDYCKEQNVHKNILKNTILFKKEGERKQTRYTKTLSDE
tara:strand:- start:4851 stop:6110 length:1260 start_codon:yes stop_codon:yes gene_type:complete